MAHCSQAKGYPDLITRSFLSLIQSTNPQVPILGLMDFDPDGISILKCYRYGSQKLAHEVDACVPVMQWTGIKSSQLILREDESMSEDGHGLFNGQVSPISGSTLPRASVTSTSCQDPVIYLSPKDRKTAVSTLKWMSIQQGEPEIMELQRELQVMLILGTKAEIEWLDDSGNLFQWLDHEIGISLFPDPGRTYTRSSHGIEAIEACRVDYPALAPSVQCKKCGVPTHTVPSLCTKFCIHHHNVAKHHHGSQTHRRRD